MITVKQYAKERNISIQAVHQSMKSKRKRELLEGHVQVIDGVKWIDDDAIEILDRDRNKSIVVLEREDANERIKQLEEQIKILITKNADQANKLTEVFEWKADKAVEIAEANQNKKLLEQKNQENEKLQEKLANVQKTVYLKDEEIQNERLEHQNQMEQLEAQYEAKLEQQREKERSEREKERLEHQNQTDQLKAQCDAKEVVINEQQTIIEQQRLELAAAKKSWWKFWSWWKCK